MILRTILVVGIGLANTESGLAQAEKSDKVLSEQHQTNKNESRSQDVVDAAAKAKDEILSDYRITLQKIENTRAYNQQVEHLIASQLEEIKSIEVQISQVEETNKEVIPLMIDMTARLEELIATDSPFLSAERSGRLQEMKSMVNRADVSTSEKYRRILEAYQIENEYGRTIEAYRDNIELNGKTFAVDFLRVGRVALIYQTLDGERAGYWDQTKRSWAELDSSYKRSIREGLRIARKQAAPQLVEVPVQAPEVAQ